MEYQKIMNLLENTLNQPSKFRSKNWVQINDGSYGTYNTGSQIKFKTSIIRSISCEYTDVYILVKETITVENTAAEGSCPSNRKKSNI